MLFRLSISFENLKVIYSFMEHKLQLKNVLKPCKINFLFDRYKIKSV